MHLRSLLQGTPRPLVMGVLNVTPDSFSDGGRFVSREAALNAVADMVEAGVDIVDIGGESTRPGAEPVPEAVERERVLPVVEAVAGRFDVAISLDTSTPSIMRDGVAMGASLINDVRALSRPGALQAAAATEAMVCLMHMQGEPGTMQEAPAYGNVVSEVRAFLAKAADRAMEAGVARDRLILDPGFGFGKTGEHNLALLRQLKAVDVEGLPLLVGLSRKRLIGELTGRPVGQRLAGSLALALVAVQRGARIVRVHDVPETVDALRIWQAISEDEREG
ncbi:MAG: dihydropteroate synthase [Halothiobacillaceae bacterium]